MKKQFLILFAFISVLAFGQVPQRFNKVVVTGDITSPKFIKTGSNADSVLLGNGSARSVNSLKTDTVSLSNRINAKAAGNGTANGTNTGDETLTSIKTKLGAATSVSDGYLKYQDWSIFNSKEPAITKNSGFNLPLGTTPGTVLEGRTFGTAAGSAVGDFQPTITGLTNNYIPKWNGNNFVNGLTSDDGSNLYLYGSSKSSSFKIVNPNEDGVVMSSIELMRISTLAGVKIQTNRDATHGGVGFKFFTTQSNADEVDGNYYSMFEIDRFGVSKFNSITPSTSPTTGALVVGGGVGADHVRANNFYGNGSNLTGVQLPITLTTNGTSGAATFENGVMNVPNYTSSGSFIQNQSSSAQSGSLWVSGNIISNDKIEGITISTESVDINTSGAQINFYGTSGSGVLNQPFRGLNYKKVMIYLANFVGNNNINYLTAFTYPPAIVITDGLSSSLITSKSTTSVTITSASSATGILILEGY